VGPRSDRPRDHRITIAIPLDASTGEPRHAERVAVAEAARRSLGACFPDVPSERLDVRELTHGRRSAADSPRPVVGVEASAIASGRPSPEAVDRLRSILTEEGYAVALRERRECTEASCAAEVAVDWNRPDHIPSGWFSAIICGRHDYRACKKCDSIFRLTSTNAAGQAPSVHCEICGAVLVEWGSSKVWDAQLVKDRSVE
jgi:hypothetical protein